MKMPLHPCNRVSTACSQVMRDEWGKSTGVGFVCFTTPSSAACAIGGMNGKVLRHNPEGRPLYVAAAQPKQERRNMLQSHTKGQPMGQAQTPPGLAIPLHRVSKARIFDQDAGIRHAPSPQLRSCRRQSGGVDLQAAKPFSSRDGNGDVGMQQQILDVYCPPAGVELSPSMVLFPKGLHHWRESRRQSRPARRVRSINLAN